MPTIDEYLNNITPPQKAEFERIRKIIRQTVPDVEEMISYGMPTFKYKKQPLVYFGAFKNHMSLFPTPGPTEMFKDKLKDFKVSKGTIQFTLEHPLPEPLIKEILLSRLAGIAKNQ